MLTTADPERPLPDRVPGGTLIDRLPRLKPSAALGLVVATLAFMLLTATDLGGQAALWENAHLTAAALGAVTLAFAGARLAQGLDRTVRLSLAVGLGCYLVGQLSGDLQTLLGVTYLKAPSDVFLLLATLPAMYALYRAVHRRVERTEEIAAFLDSAVVSLGISAVLVAVYAQHTTFLPGSAGLLDLAYPILYLAAGGAGLVGALTIRSPF